MTHALPAPARDLFALLRGDPVEPADWDAVGVYALSLGLGPLLLETAAERLPPLLSARLRLAARRTELRTRALLDALAEVLQMCNQQGAPALVLKGAYMAPAIYKNLSLRSMSDIDLLIEPHAFTQFQAIMKALGYEGKHTDPQSGPGIVKHEWTYQRANSPKAAANPLLFGGESLFIEPHVSLTESWFGLKVGLTHDVWSRRVEWRLRDSSGRSHLAYALCPEDALLHAAIHAIFHLLMGKAAFIQLYDIRRLLEVQVDLDFEALLATALHPDVSASAHLLAALRLARDAYAAPVPRLWLERLSEACPSRQREAALALSLERMWRMSQQAPLTTLAQRLRRGMRDRFVAAAWARDRREVLRVWRSAFLFHRTDTARLLLARLSSRSERSNSKAPG
ncbi:MAG: hypothetical protein GXP42_03095 [Chloroflexi bacterium]|nr:hypothetical protein [Chloroflexota bacterium]